ncbi:Transcription factor DIVARICATA [Tetrabaena socialis]|uniref:Transcription factor DIVARICATA n=1 Tax=Tetrabaena socialis TaxID=47790 RepID=A0A2J8AF07_9CHLO|nr:Transcription factor DIVARICATA [Tetrabaena socialis]|eukprot:PNH11111.1 Transcription factor DIVARICATA [Tetrabaena socialis]
MAAGFSLCWDYVQPSGMATFWRLEENKVFEVALAKHYLDEDRYERIASYLPNKSLGDVQKRFRELEDDLRRIDEGCSEGASEQSSAEPSPTRSDENMSQQPSKKAKTDVPANGDRRKGVPWTEEEHRLFLLGLSKFGKGDWRSIARNFVVSRTPTQVASHAQKYFIRLNSLNKKDKRRASIHDITSPTLPAHAPNANPTTGSPPAAPASPPQPAAPPCSGPAPVHSSLPTQAQQAAAMGVFTSLALGMGMSMQQNMTPTLAMPTAPFMVSC